MKTAARFLPLLAILILVTGAGSPVFAAPAHFWSRHSNAAVVATSFPFGSAVDASGNVYVTGKFNGTVNLGGSSLVSAGQSDFFLAKYNSAGVLLWSVRYGGTGNDGGNAVAVDGAGNVYITGSYGNATSFGGSTLLSSGGGDMVLAKYTSAGAYVWSKGFGSSGFDRGTSIAVTQAGTIYTAGLFAGTLNLGGSNLVTTGSDDIYLARFDTNGNHVWSSRYGGTAGEWQPSVAINAAGEMYMAAGFQFGAGFGGMIFTSAGLYDIVLAKYTALGAHIWSKKFGAVDSDIANSVEVDATGNVLVTGEFEDTVDFGGGGGGLVSAGDTDIFMAKYTSAGVHVWSKRFGGTGSDSGSDIAADPTGHIALTGWFNGTTNFGGAPFTSAGNDDIFLARYDSNGAQQWSQAFGSTDFDDGYTCVSDANGNVVLGANFIGTVDFGGGPFTDSSVSGDFVLARYGAYPRAPRVTSIVDVPNDQGRNVKVTFERTGYDDASASTPVQGYEFYRRDTAPPASSLRTASMSSGELMLAGWQFAGSMPAHHEDSNIGGAPTVGDSTIALGQYYSAFFVRAATADPYTFFDSPVDSGYSVDNIAPPAPQSLAFNAGNLTWLASPAADFDYFTIYGSSSPVLDGSAVQIDYTTGINFNASASPHTFYYVTATDFSGNEGKAARVNTLSGIGSEPALPRALEVNAYPNPFNPRTTIRYDVPKAGVVSVKVYDATGAFVTELVKSEARNPGAYSVPWDGRTAGGGAVGSGVYFIEVRSGHETKTRKITLVK